MFRKIVMSLGLVIVFTFISCGGGSSEEAKEILKKVLTVIGFPPEVITNICQTSNSSDICEGLKLHKLENSKTKTWQKIEETGVGQYLLETNNPCKPILLELKDDDVEYDSGKFFLKFSGVEFGETTKELSILEAMVDASYLLASSVSSIKTLNSSDAQNKFYATLYGDLKKNINTLRTAGLTKTQSIRGTLKEMAEELKDYGVDSTLPTKINACNDDMGCVEGELTELSSKLLIYASETDAIVEAQKDNNAPLSVREIFCKEEVKYGKWIKPSKNICENNGGNYYDDKYSNPTCSSNWENAKKICDISGGKLPSKETLSQIVTDCGGTINDLYDNNYTNNRINESYQVCYRNKGFVATSTHYWSSSIFNYLNGDKGVLIILLLDGEVSLDSPDNSLGEYVQCIQDK